MAVPEQVLDDLHSDDEEVRRAALTRLASESDLRALPTLRDITASDESMELRFMGKRAILMLAGIRPDMDPASLKLPRVDDADPGRRVAAVQAHAVRGKGEDLALLEERAAVEKDKQVRPIIALALGAAGTRAQIPALDRLLEDPDPAVRRAALEGLTLVRDAAAYPYFVRYGRDADDAMRALAVRQLGQLGRDKVLRLCEVMARAPRPWMVASALSLLSGLRDGKHVPLFAAALKHADPEVRERAREGLSRMIADGVSEAASALDASGVTRRDEDFLLAARNADLPETGPDELRAADPQARLAYIQAVVTRRDTEAVPALISRLERETDNRVLAMLVTALGQLGNPDAVEGLRDFLKSKNDRVRANAIEALGRLLPPTDRGVLVKSLDDPHNRARTNAVLALWGHGHSGVREALAALKASTDKKARLSAIYAIGQIGEAASGLLNELLDDPDREVQQKAKECWRMLGLEDASGSALSPASIIPSSAKPKTKKEKVLEKGPSAKELEAARDAAVTELADAYAERVGKDVVAPPEIVPLLAAVTAARAKLKHNKPETRAALIDKQLALCKALIAGNHWEDEEANELFARFEEAEAAFAAAPAAASAGGGRGKLVAALVLIVALILAVSYYFVMMQE